MVPFCHSWSQLVLPTLSFLTLCAHICFSTPVVAKRGTGINSFNAFTVWSVDVVPACLSLELWCYGARPGTPLAGTKSMRQGLWTALNCHLPMSRLFYVLSLLCFPLKPEDLAYDYPSLRDVWRIKKLMQLQAKVSQTDTRLITLNWEPKEFQNNVLNIRSVACLTVIVLKQIYAHFQKPQHDWKNTAFHFLVVSAFRGGLYCHYFPHFIIFTGIKEKQKKYPTWVFKHRNISLLKRVM